MDRSECGPNETTLRASIRLRFHRSRTRATRTTYEAGGKSRITVEWTIDLREQSTGACWAPETYPSVLSGGDCSRCVGLRERQRGCRGCRRRKDEGRRLRRLPRRQRYLGNGGYAFAGRATGCVPSVAIGVLSQRRTQERGHEPDRRAAQQ